MEDALAWNACKVARPVLVLVVGKSPASEGIRLKNESVIIPDVENPVLVLVRIPLPPVTLP